MGINCLAQEHNAVPRPGLEPGKFDPESNALTIRPPRLPVLSILYVSLTAFNTSPSKQFSSVRDKLISDVLKGDG